MKQREFKMIIKCWKYFHESLTARAFFLQQNKLNIEVIAL